jgi:hypothetical protein
MKFRLYLLLYLYALMFLLAVSIFQTQPGYMDAEYYYANGVRLTQGKGFSELFLWNYLDNPKMLPHPSFTYWMPLSSLLAAAGMELTGWVNFAGSKTGFLLLAACVSPLTARLAYALTNERWAALLAGFLAIFPGFYLAYLGITDTFGIAMVLGLLWLWVAHHALKRSPGERAFFLDGLGLGLVAGLMHLNRADGLIWLGMGGLVIGMVLLVKRQQRESIPFRTQFFIGVIVFAIFIVGYVLPMLPWFWRNQITFGTLFSPGSVKVLWITDYDDIYIYPASQLTPARWWAIGLGEIVRARLWALGQNLQTALAVQGMVFLLPLILVGAWHLRKDRRVQLGALSYFLIMVLFSLVFPFPGARGGFFHSGAGLQPLWWALVPVGLAVWINWGEKKRGWKATQARVILGVGLVGLAAFYSILITWPKVIGNQVAKPVWNQSAEEYIQLVSYSEKLGISDEAIGMVNNPPGYFTATGKMAIVIPDGGMTDLLDAAQRYYANYVFIDENHPEGLADLYKNPVSSLELIYIGKYKNTQIFRIDTNED